MTAMEARTKTQIAQVTEEARIKKEATEFCNTVCNEAITKACDLCHKQAIVTNVPAELTEKVLEILVINGYRIYKIDNKNIEINW